MASASDKYADYVEHPRYGKGPRYTVLNPESGDSEALSRAHTGGSIPYTEILADPELQADSLNPVTYYCDLDRLCRDCGRSFIFFAEEQRYWYETLKFKLPAGCVRCIECRKKRQKAARLRERYQHLSRRIERTDHETLEMAESCLILIETGEFTHNKLSRVRELLNSLSADASPTLRKQTQQLLERVRALES